MYRQEPGARAVTARHRSSVVSSGESVHSASVSTTDVSISIPSPPSHSAYRFPIPSSEFRFISPRSDSPGHAILNQWRRLSPLPGGQWLFSKLLGWRVPYSGSVSPRILLLEPGHARVRIAERRALRQHLGSVHAVALMNVAELASGLAMMGALPTGMRGIVIKIGIEYFKKARGVLLSESRCVVAPDVPPGEYDFISDVTDEAGDVVARATVTWKLDLIPE